MSFALALTAQFLRQGSLPEGETDSKKPRRSERLTQSGPGKDKTPISHKQHLPSPVTHNTDGSDSIEQYKETTATPRSEVATPRKTDEAYGNALSSPPQDTQPLSQFIGDKHPSLLEDSVDEIKEGIWGYLVPLDPKYGDRPVVLKRRSACPKPDEVQMAASKEAEHKKHGDKASTLKEEEAYEDSKIGGVSSGGYLIGRHAECGKQSPTNSVNKSSN